MNGINPVRVLFKLISPYIGTPRDECQGREILHQATELIRKYNDTGEFDEKLALKVLKGLLQGRDYWAGLVQERWRGSGCGLIKIGDPHAIRCGTTDLTGQFLREASEYQKRYDELVQIYIKEVGKPPNIT